MPDIIQFGTANQIINRYAASRWLSGGRKLGTEYFTRVVDLAVPLITGKVNHQTYTLNVINQNGTVYIDNKEYSTLNGNPALTALQRIYNAEGYADTITATIPNYKYYRRDHLGNNREVWVTNTKKTIQRTQYYPSGLPWASNTGDNPSQQERKYNGKEFIEMHGYDTYDYGARGYYAAMGRFTTLDPMAEKYYSISPYAYCAGNPLKYTDPTGMLYGDYYNEDIKKIGTDGNKDGKKYIVIDKNEANKIKKTDKAGGTTQRSDVKSAILKPSQDVMTASNKAIQNTDNTRNEYGFVAATDGSTSTIQTNNDPGSVQLGPGYQELEGQGKQTSFDVHIHPDKVTINTNGTFTADDPNPSGTPGQQGDDFGYRTMKENNGQVSEPSWVIGTQTTVTNNNDVINKYQIRVVTFYKSTGIVGQMDWTKFQNIVNKIP